MDKLTKWGYFIVYIKETLVEDVVRVYIKEVWLSKTDSAPVRGDGYEPGSSKFRPRANAETSHSACKQEVVMVSVVGVSEKFSHGILRSRKPLFWCPFIIQLLPPTKHLCDLIWMNSI